MCKKDCCSVLFARTEKAAMAANSAAVSCSGEEHRGAEGGAGLSLMTFLHGRNAKLHNWLKSFKPFFFVEEI